MPVVNISHRPGTGPEWHHTDFLDRGTSSIQGNQQVVFAESRYVGSLHISSKNDTSK